MFKNLSVPQRMVVIIGCAIVVLFAAALVHLLTRDTTQLATNKTVTFAEKVQLKDCNLIEVKIIDVWYGFFNTSFLYEVTQTGERIRSSKDFGKVGDTFKIHRVTLEQ